MDAGASVSLFILLLHKGNMSGKSNRRIQKKQKERQHSENGKAG